MLSFWTVMFITGAYLVLLFLFAWFAGRLKGRGRRFLDNRLVYALTITVYCTSWTYFGNVSLATHTGPLYLAIYLGPTLAAFSWWMILRRTVRVTRDYRIKSIADLMALRYGMNSLIGAVVALIMIFGIAPMIGLQLKAVDSALDLASRGSLVRGHPGDFQLMLALLIGVFGMVFGTRITGRGERHEGMVAVVAFESVVKLAAILIVGVYVTYVLFDGFGDIFSRMSKVPEYSRLLTLLEPDNPYIPAWSTLLALSAVSVLLLPYQFQMMVVENTSEKHIPDAMWIFPLYLFLINLFILPIAFGGLLIFGNTAQADSFILALPLSQGNGILTVIVLIGGLSAATGVIIVSSMALSTMFINNLCMPLMLKVRLGHGKFPSMLAWARRGAILAVCLIAYGFNRLIGDSMELVTLGLVSFGAAAQLAPAFFGGVMWRKATAKGALAGLVIGFFVWFYTFLLPACAMSGVIPGSWLSEGPLGIALLRPNALFGLEGLDIWSHGLFWSLLLNGGAFFFVYTMTTPGRDELLQIARLIYAEGADGAGRSEFGLKLAPTPGEFEELMTKFVGPEKSRRHMREFLGSGFRRDERLTEQETIRLGRHVERVVGGVIGPTAASEVIERYMGLGGTRMEQMLGVFGSISVSLENSREELENRLRELSVLFEASKEITSTLDEKKAVDQVLRLLENDFGLANLGVFLVDGEKLNAVRVVGIHQRLVERLISEPAANTLINRAVDSKSPVVGSVVEGDTSLELLPRFGLMCAVAVPMLKETEVIGVLFAAKRGEEAAFSEKFVETLEALAGELALSVANARLYKEVTELNRTLEEKVRERTAELQAAMENLKEMDRVKSEFLANVSHELRTPMNSILGYTNLVMDGVDGPLNEEQSRSLERVDANARHLLDLINELLDLSRIEAGKMRLEMEMVDLGSTAREVGADMTSFAAQKNIGLLCRVEGEDLYIQADPVRVREVLLNLLSNAVKFTTTGSVTVNVRPEKRSGVEGVLVDVVDTGPGIPEKDIEAIFEAFKQLDGSATRVHQGVGLGLSIAKKLVEMHGGTIGASSVVGEGSTFTVWWPKVAQVPEHWKFHGQEDISG